MSKITSNLLLLIYYASSIYFLSCNVPKKGDLKGVNSKKWFSERPYGMSLVPQGAFQMGNVSTEILKKEDTRSKRVSISAFYMDETEITNAEYRNFVLWVRDSIIRTNLGDIAEQMHLTKKDRKTVGEYAYKHVDTSKMTIYQKYMYENYPKQFGKRINWKKPLQWDERKYISTNYRKAIDDMYKPFEAGLSNARILDIDKLKFSYNRLELEHEISQLKNKSLLKTEVLKVYPDTLVWIKDYNYAYNEPRHNEYFYNKAYREYPVVGVDWYQARGFCVWRTLLRKKYQKTQRHALLAKFRLPTEIEWEYAASGGNNVSKFPWSYAIDKKGCYKANFKPLRGDYSVDGSLYTSRTGMYNSNNFNLYDMSGNVSEWTMSTYSPNSYFFENDINPNYNNHNKLKKVIRGGSWKDIHYYIQISTRDYEYADSSRSYLGFRTVQDYLGAPNKM